jgi:hypothetical protein
MLAASTREKRRHCYESDAEDELFSALCELISESRRNEYPDRFIRSLAKRAPRHMLVVYYTQIHTLERLEQKRDSARAALEQKIANYRNERDAKTPGGQPDPVKHHYQILSLMKTHCAAIDELNRFLVDHPFIAQLRDKVVNYC